MNKELKHQIVAFTLRPSTAFWGIYNRGYFHPSQVIQYLTQQADYRFGKGNWFAQTIESKFSEGSLIFSMKVSYEQRN